MPHLQDYEEQIAKDSQRVEKLNQLGVESGQNFAADLEHGYLESISDVIDEVVLPSIVSIAEASRSGNTIVVPISLFTRRVATSMELFSGDDENCDFLCGFIEGLSSSVPGHESVSVIETRCRVDGDPACVFSLV
ncbi:MAG: 4-vinyl reductase [Gammaproteobacteria bacterium]|nr:4-vinyl reductase [Gammaproteobacteria bacterium]